MLSIKICTVYYIFLNIVVEINTLVPLPIVEEHNIVTTEKAIRNTVNSLFETFKVHGIRNRPKIKQFSTIHNFFVSITLIDCNNLEKIARLSRVNVTDNSTQNFIAQINEILNSDDKNYEEHDNNLHVATYIENFIQKLKHLKEAYMSNKNNVINSKILQYIDSDTNTLINVTKSNINSSKTNKEVENEKIFDEDDVWQPNSRRIYQGIRLSIKKFPFMASVHFFNKFQCAGSIIKNDLVITSASCLQIAWNNRFFRENPAFLSVRIGCEYYDFCGESISVLEIYFHPQYDPKTLKHNIAIMRLNKIINFHRSHGKVKKIEVDKSPWGLPVTCSITVVGWGAKDHSNIIYDVFRSKLSYANLDIYILQDCQEHYSKEFVTHRNFCGGFYSKGGGACNHDAGGPGICDNTLMGVISFGSPTCGATGSPTVFTKLGFYWEWINNIMELKSAFKEVRSTARTPKPTFTFPEPSTTTVMKMLPVADTTALIPIMSESSEINALRIAQEQDFKDFLSTIFESVEIKAYLDTSDTEAQVEEKQFLNGDKTQKKMVANVIEENFFEDDIVKPNFEKDGERKTSELLTPGTNLIRNIDSSNTYVNDRDKTKDISVEAVTEKQIRVTVIDNVSYDDKRNDDEGNIDEIDDNRANNDNEQINDAKIVENNLMALIDNLDIDELVKSISSVEAGGKNNENKENRGTQKKKNNYIKNEAISNKTEINIKASSNQKPVQEIKFDKNDEREEENGLSIEVEPFIFSSLRDRRNNTETNNVLSDQSSIFNFITLAIEEQAKKMKKKKGYLL